MLQHVPVLRTLISQLRLLILRQSDIHSRVLPLSILTPACKAVNDTSNDAEDCEGYTDGIACDVLGRVLLQESINGDDAANVSELLLSVDDRCLING